VVAVARENRTNSAREWLYSLKWDDVERLRFLMPVGFGAIDNAYSQAVGRCFMMSLAKRILEPGCQQDYMVILEGEQGTRKNSALRALAEPWYCELHDEMGSLEWKIAIQGKILCEIAELHALRRSEVEKVKAAITARVDRFRSKYGTWAMDHPRVCCFVATTNEETYLTDTTGNRRFWPVKTGQIDVDWIAHSKDQLWAEAAQRLAQDEAWWDVPEVLAKQEQELRMEDDARLSVIREYMFRRQGRPATLAEVLQEALAIMPGDMGRHYSAVGKLMRALGYTRKRIGHDWCYCDSNYKTPTDTSFDDKFRPR
jgi:putative DNA primase/helicase